MANYLPFSLLKWGKYTKENNYERILFKESIKDDGEAIKSAIIVI